jgi:hypothetical protein
MRISLLQTTVMILGLCVALGVIYFVHKLVAVHDAEKLIAMMEGATFTFILGGLVLKDVWIFATQVAHPSSRFSFDFGAREIITIFAALLGSLILYIGAKKLL